MSSIATHLVRGHGADAVLLLHGADGGMAMWDEDGARTVQALADGGMRAVAIELPGLHRADASDPAALAAGVEAVAGVAALMSARRLALVGHGLGGAVALQLLAARPGLVVHALVLADAASAPVQSSDLPTLRLTAAAAGHGCIEQPEVFNAAVLSFLQSHGFGS